MSEGINDLTSKIDWEMGKRDFKFFF